MMKIIDEKALCLMTPILINYAYFLKQSQGILRNECLPE